MTQQNPPLIIQISSSLCTAIFDCRIFSNCQMNIYLTSTVELKLVKHHSRSSTQPPRSVPNMISLTVVSWHLRERFRQTKCALIMH